LSRDFNHSDQPSTLPAPELNPLLNPVLGQNMGRWAEVYYTNPPEKREQAVLELVRELEKEKPESTAPIHNIETTNREPVFSNATSSAAISSIATSTTPAVSEFAPRELFCVACGHENPASQKFCGMCGALLEKQRPDEPREFPSPAVQAEAVDDTPENPPTSFFTKNHSDVEFIPTEEVRGFAANDLSLFRAASHGDEDMDSTGSTRYRVYLGIAIALLLGALGYMAWQHSQRAPENSSREAPPVPAASAPEPVKPADQDRRVETQPASPGAAASTPPATRRAVYPAPARKAAAPAKVEENAPEPVVVDNGSAEFATAERYLSAMGGSGRDSSEAAKWLWKAMAKHNPDATFALADLYMRGDGVPKNCDQAHVLLDAAARAGMKGAGERLRHLQAFGCQ
jgi:hypothetical protein